MVSVKHNSSLFFCSTDLPLSFGLKRKKTNIWLMVGSSVPAAKKKKIMQIITKTKQILQLSVAFLVLNKTLLFFSSFYKFLFLGVL